MITTPTVAQTLSANEDQMPRALAQSVVTVTFDMYTPTISGTLPQIKVTIRDTTAGAAIRTSTGHVITVGGSAMFNVTVRCPYLIPAGGPRGFSFEVSNTALGGETIGIRNPSIEVRDAGI